MTLRDLASAVKRRAKRLSGKAAMTYGRAASTKPLSVYYGFDRGTPVDRYYIERFLARYAADIRGTVLEVGDPSYARRFGGDRITEQHVLDVDPANASATIVGDLSEPDILPAQAFDCIILTQTLHVIFDMPTALRNLRQALRPDGVLLITVPGITPVRPGDGYGWYWSLTGQALAKLLEAAFEHGRSEVAEQGNLFAATAFLHGAALEEIATRKLDPPDPAYPVIVTGRAVA